MNKKYKEILQNFDKWELIVHAVLVFNNYILKQKSTIIFYVKCFVLNIKVGENAKVWGPVYISKFPSSRITIGNNLRNVSAPSRYAFNIFPQSKIRTMSPTSIITIKDNVGFNSVSILARSGSVTIGENTMIGGNCQITDTDGHPLWPPEERHVYSGDEHDSDVFIGNNVFIGINVIILKGSTIGDNSVIAAGSIVNGEIPGNCLAAGVPAKVIKYFE